MTDNLRPFPTDVRDACQYDVDKLSADLPGDLQRIYTGIRLSNSIVWVSAEFNRQTGSPDENYRRLWAGIVARLDRRQLMMEERAKW